MELQTQAGINPLAGAMGYTAGSPAARALAPFTGTSRQFQSAMAQTYSQLGTQYSYQAALYGWDSDRKLTEMRMEQQQADVTGATMSARMRRSARRTGSGLEAIGLFPGTPEAEAFADTWAPESEDDIVGWDRYLRAVEAVGETWQTRGKGITRGSMVGTYLKAEGLEGVSPAAAGRIADLATGGISSLGGAFGGISAIDSGANRVEQMLLEVGVGNINIEKLGSLGQFGASELGYSMMGGGWGGTVGTMAGMAYNAMSQLGVASMPQGQPLYVQRTAPTTGGQGIYSWGQLEMDAMAQAYQEQGFARTLGTGRWATQSVPSMTISVPTHRSQFTQAQLQAMGVPETQKWIDQDKTIGGGTFQMGLIGQTQEAILQYQEMHQLRGIDAQMRAESRAQQDRQSGAQAERLALQRRHALESLAMQEQMWSVNVAYNRQEAAFGWEQMQTQQAWQYQDFALGRQQAGYAHEFQMGEMRRSWRLAGGRQKAALGRQMEYQEEMFSFAETQRGNAEERFRTQEQWDEERFQREREHFEEVTALQEEQFAMQRRHIEEKYALEMGLIGEQMKHIQKMRELEDRRRDITEKAEDRAAQRRIAEAMQQEEYYKTVEIPYRRWVANMENQIRDAHAEYMQWQLDQINVKGQMEADAFKQLAKIIETELGVEIGSPGQWRDLEHKVEEPPRVPVPEGLPDWMKGTLKLVIDDSTELSAYIATENQEQGLSNSATGEWDPYGE